MSGWVKSKFSSLKSTKNNNFFSFFGATLICLSACAAIGVGVWYTVTNYIPSSQYINSHRVRIALDLTHENDSPFYATDNDIVSKEEKMDKVNQTISAFSRYLESQKVETFNTVSFASMNSDETIAYMDVNIPLEWVKEVDEYGRDIPDAKKVSVPAINAYFNTVTSNRIVMIGDIDVARDFNTGDPVTNWNKGFTSVIPMDALYTNAKNDIKYSVDKKSVVIRTPENNPDAITSSKWNDFISDAFKNRASTSDDADDKNAKVPSLRAEIVTTNPAFYILRDQETLITRMHYILQAFTAHNRPDVINASEYDEAWRYLSQSEKDWANAVLPANTSFLNDNLFTGTKLTNTTVNYNEFINYTRNSEIIASNDTVNEWYESSIQQFNNNFFYRLIDSSTITNSKDNSGIQFPAKADTSGGLSVAYEWMQPYVLGIITAANYSNFFPTSDPTLKNPKVDEDNLGKWFNISANSSFDASQIYNALTGKFNFVYPIKSVSTGLNNAKISGGIISVFKQNSNPEIGVSDTSLNERWFYPSTFNGGFFNQIPNSLISSLVAYIVCIFIIGIFISVIYRIPGVLAFLLLLATNVLAVLSFVATNHPLSFSVFLGLLTASFVFAIAVISILERTHKNLVLQNTTADSSFKKAIKSGTWPTFDLFIISIIISTCFIYFGALSIYEFGLLTLLFSLLSIGMFTLWLCATFLLFSNQKMRRHKTYMSNKKTVTDTVLLSPTSMPRNETEFETSFLTHHFRPNMHYKFFHKKVEMNALKIVVTIVIGIFVALMVVGNMLGSHIGGQNSAIVNTLVALSVALGFLSLYALIRLNWTSLLSIVVANITISIVIFPIVYFTKASTFNEALCIMGSLYILINAFLFHFVSNINNHWVQHQFLVKDKLTQVINIETRSASYYFYSRVIWLYVFVVVALSFFSPLVLLPLFAISLGLFLASLCFAYFVVKNTIFYFIQWRNNYRKLLYEREFFIDTSLDKIDEQLIDGINHHKLIKIEL